MGRRREPGWLTDGNVVVGVANSTEVLRVTAGAGPGPSTSPSYNSCRLLGSLQLRNHVLTSSLDEDKLLGCTSGADSIDRGLVEVEGDIGAHGVGLVHYIKDDFVVGFLEQG